MASDGSLRGHHAIGDVCPPAVLVDRRLIVRPPPPPLRAYAGPDLADLDHADRSLAELDPALVADDVANAIRQVIDRAIARSESVVCARDGTRLLVQVFAYQDDSSDPLALLTFTDASYVYRNLDAQIYDRLNEARHRIRNMLGVVRSLVRRSIDSAVSMSDCANRVEGRLNAFTRIQAMVSIGAGSGIDLEYLVAEEFIANGFIEDRNFTLSGPPVRLRLKAAEAFSLVAHELLSNATERGYLRESSEQIVVRWRTETRNGVSILVWSWREPSDPAPDAPPIAGLGREVLEDLLAFEWGAQTTRASGDGGFTYLIEVPLDRVVFAPEIRA